MSATGILQQHVRPNREALLTRLAEARANTDQLFELVRPEALYDRPIAERHRLIFYVGHLEAFDWNLIATGESGGGLRLDGAGESGGGLRLDGAGGDR